MPSEKRQRKRQHQQARQVAAVSARRRARLRQRIVVALVAFCLLAAVVVLVSVTQAKDKSKRTSQANEKPRAAEAPICPKPDGSSPRTTSFSASFSGCIDLNRSYTATIKTNKGSFTMALDQRRAPTAVNSFVALARYHFYDGLTFHRIVPGFVIQGGDPQGTGAGGPGYKFADELPPAGSYRVGTVAMANSGPNTNGSQFFVITGPQGTALPPNYSSFAQVTSGMETVEAVDRLGRPETQGDPAGGKPKEPVRIESVTIEER